MSPFFALLQRDLKLAIRQGVDTLMVITFFILVIVLFPLAIGPENKTLSQIGSGIIWVAALLAALLSMDRLFHGDYEDGSLELLLLASPPLEFLVLAKILAHWLTTGLPLILVSPLLGVLLDIPPEAFWAIVSSLLLGTPVLSLIGAIGSALILGARKGGALLTLLVLPLFIPILVFGAGSVDATLMGFPSEPSLYFLGAMLLVSFALCPWVVAIILKNAIE